MNYYTEIKNKLIENENYSRIKDYSKERYRVITYFEIGRLLTEADKKYGDNIIKQYSIKLQKEVGKKYSERTLRRIRQFYYIFNKEKWSPLVTKLTWSHYVVLMSLKENRAIEYYLKISINQHLSKRQLEGRIKSKEYERLPEETKQKLIIDENESKVSDLIKNPIIIRNSNNIKITEKNLQQIILEDLPSFLKELGNGFCFIENEYKIKIGDRYNYIDLLLFNYEFNCFVVIELKVTELKKEHIGQIEVYMNYIDNNLKKLTQDKTIGIIICKKDNHFIMEYCSDLRILSREYLLETYK